MDYGLRPCLIATLLIPIAIFNVVLEPFTCITNMMNFGNKHVKDILYAICSNHLISEYSIYHYKHLNVNIDKKKKKKKKIIGIWGTIPNRSIERNATSCWINGFS
jgi:hypothetical protein